VGNVRIETGRLYTPDGTPYAGFKVTIGSVLDPSSVKRTYTDIEAIFQKNKTPYKIHEEFREGSKFKSYTIETGPI